jgi:hypothetical protein
VVRKGEHTDLERQSWAGEVNVRMSSGTDGSGQGKFRIGS